jgi:hypothetical protein
MWVYRNLHRPDAAAPSALAGRLLALGREEPDRLVLLLDALDRQAGEGNKETIDTLTTIAREPAKTISHAGECVPQSGQKKDWKAIVEELKQLRSAPVCGS